MKILWIILSVLLGVSHLFVSSEVNAAEPLRVGYIGSLSGFAGSYGTAVLEGVRLAESRLNGEGSRIQLFVEDDKSNPKETATAYQKLRSMNKIDALITGTWWANSIVRTVERDGIPFLSCETLYNKEFIPARNYFLLLGDLRDWISVYKPLVERRAWKRGAIVHFVSGFAQTLSEEMSGLFSSNERKLVKDIEYSDFDMSEAATIATQLKAAQPEVVYLDGQPSSVSKLINRLSEQQAKGLVIFSNSIISDAVENGILDPSSFPGEIYFSRRGAFLTTEFIESFKQRYKRAPILNSDLGYFSLLLLHETQSAEGDRIDAIKSGKLTVDGVRFAFDEHNAFRGIGQKLFTFRQSKIVALDDEKGT